MPPSRVPFSSCVYESIFSPNSSGLIQLAAVFLDIGGYTINTAYVHLLVAKGKVEVADVGVGILACRHIDLEDDTVAGRKATGRWVGGTGCRTGQP